MFVCCDCLLSSGRRLFDGPTTRPEESYGMCVCVCLIECDPEYSKEAAWARFGS